MTSFWKGRLCLITGVDGFLGSHLAKRLVAEGASVVGLSFRRKTLCSLELLGVEESIEHITGVDGAEYRQVQQVFEHYDVDTCFHLAATSTLPQAAQSPFRTFETNVKGTWNILEVARQCGSIRAVVVASSDKAYGDHDGDLPYRAGSALRGIHVYDASKACVEFVSHTYFFQYRVPIWVTRCSNIYGPGDLNLSRLIPGNVMRALMGLPALIHGGQQNTRREFLYIDDAVDAYLRLGESTRFSDSDWERIQSMPGHEAFGYCAFNIGGGPDNVKTVREVVDAIGAIVNGELPPPTVSKRLWPPVLDISDQRVDSSRILSERGWSPTVRLIPDGLLHTVEWYRVHGKSLKSIADEVINGFKGNE